MTRPFLALARELAGLAFTLGPRAIVGAALGFGPWFAIALIWSNSK